MFAPVRLGERVRLAARQTRRGLPGRPLWDRCAAVGALRAGDDGARDDVDDPIGLDRRARRADDRAVARRALRRHRSHPPADRPRRRSHARADGCVHPGRGPGRGGVRAHVRVRPPTGRVAYGGRRLEHGAGDRRDDDDPARRRICESGSRATARGRGTRCPRASGGSSRSAGPGAWTGQATWRTPATAWR